MSVYRYFQKITSIGVYRQTNTYTHNTYTSTHSGKVYENTQVYTKVHDYEIQNKKYRRKVYK